MYFSAAQWVLQDIFDCTVGFSDMFGQNDKTRKVTITSRSKDREVAEANNTAFLNIIAYMINSPHK